MRRKLAEMRDEQVECQMGWFHPFRIVPAEDGDIPDTWPDETEQNAIIFVKECVVCGTRRVEVINRYTGERAWAPIYRHPDWWVHFTYDTRPTQPMLNLQYIERPSMGPARG